jgi:hypothetical protein
LTVSTLNDPPTPPTPPAPRPEPVDPAKNPNTSDPIFKFILYSGFLIGLVAYTFLVLASAFRIGVFDEDEEIIAGILLGIGAALGTNFGAYMGIQMTKPENLRGLNILPNIKWPTIQAAAALYYFVLLGFCLVVALVYLGGFVKDDAGQNVAVPTLIATQALTFVGVFAGLFALALNRGRT